MRTSARLVCLFTILAAPAAAQSTTEEGIRAMLRGDYQAAARILRPLADDAVRPDPVARFFLAFLYDTGHGVQPDQLRACGLFLGAGTRPNPFAEQSAAIAALMQEQLGGPSLLCVADESWYGEPPQSFVLGPGHRIVFAETSISLAYGDKEWRTPMQMSRGAVFLPVQYTPLAVTRPAVARRHFFQWFGWIPDRAVNPASWSLQWILSEVEGDRLIPITSEAGLVVVNGPTRPASYDVTNVVRLRINGSGEAEFTIVGSSSPRTEVIEWKGSR